VGAIAAINTEIIFKIAKDERTLSLHIFLGGIISTFDITRQQKNRTLNDMTITEIDLRVFLECNYIYKNQPGSQELQ
jgi:hypothetical protein